MLRTVRQQDLEGPPGIYLIHPLYNNHDTPLCFLLLLIRRGLMKRGCQEEGLATLWFRRKPRWRVDPCATVGFLRLILGVSLDVFVLFLYAALSIASP
jgi:hypothetical protein